jgi:DNA-damage-inducible protein J
MDCLINLKEFIKIYSYSIKYAHCLYVMHILYYNEYYNDIRRDADMANTSMNIRMDSEIKKQAQELFAQFGLDMTTAVNMFLRQSIREQGIPFQLKINTPNEVTVASFEEGERMLNDPSATRFSSVESLFEDLNS